MKHICSINGIVQTLEKASLPLSEIESQYNFGVYETIKVRNSLVYFIKQHINRLFHSAEAIGLNHDFSLSQIALYLTEFVEALQEESINVKILLYGRKTHKEARLIILPSSPFYPNRKWYREGVTLISFEYERWMPQAKTLNMLPSYVMYQKAKEQGAYDALLLDRNRHILEGTRTNVFLMKDNIIYSPPKEVILEGVTLMTLAKVIEHSDFTLIYKAISYESIHEYDGMILSSTSSKILPVKQIDQCRFHEISPEIGNLIAIYNTALDTCNGDFERL